jgi:predicted nucleic acid-binding protein
MYLVDTNVASEPQRARPSLEVVTWFRTVPQDLLYFSVISLAEVIRGIKRHRDPAREASLQRWLDHDLRSWVGEGLIAFTGPIAELTGSITALRDRAGRPISFTDAGIAATAIVHDLVLVTRNTKDFAGLPLQLLNPWNDTIPTQAPPL